MREFWVNVYASATKAFCGVPHETMAAAEATAFAAQTLAYRLHVRLKPEPATREDLSEIMHGDGHERVRAYPEGECPSGMTHAQWERVMGRR